MKIGSAVQVKPGAPSKHSGEKGKIIGEKGGPKQRHCFWVEFKPEETEWFLPKFLEDLGDAGEDLGDAGEYSTETPVSESEES